MRTHEPIDWDIIGYHLRELPRAFNARRIELENLTDQLHDLEQTRCTGTEHWRDADNKGRKPKLYVIHGINTGCPIHGQPQADKRIRTYIGSKPEKIAAARIAIEKGKLYEATLKSRDRMHVSIQSASHTLRRIFWTHELDTSEPPSETHE